MALHVTSRPTVVTVNAVETEERRTPHSIELPAYERERFEDVAFMTAMTLVLLGNYSQTGHYGGPLAYTPYNVAIHLGGPEVGGLRYDLRDPKHPFADKFMLTGGHSIPTCYALWMILCEAMRRQREATGKDDYAIDPNVAILSVDALGFRRSPGAVRNLLSENGLSDDPRFAQAKLRGIRSLAGHSETTDLTNDVNGGPSGIGIATAAGKALFWDAIGAPPTLKLIAFEGEFALTAGHAQEVKTAALAQQVGKRLRVLLSYNNAGIDDQLVGSVVKPQYQGYDIAQQWTSYGWNVLSIEDGNRFDDVFGALKAMEDWPVDDRRPMIVIGPTLKGWWPGAIERRIPGYDGEMLVGAPSHPYALAMNGDYFVALAETFEKRYGVTFEGIRDGAPKSEPERLTQFMTNVQIAMSVMDERPGLREWIADRVVDIAGKLDRSFPVKIATDRDPFRDERLKVENLPTEPVEAVLKNPHTGEEAKRTIALFLPPGEKRGTRRALSEIGKWMNYVTGNRFYTAAADLSDSINVEKCHFFGHYDPVTNPAGTRLKAPIQEAVNASTIIGLINQTASSDPEIHAGMGGLSGTYGSFTPLMYTPARVYSQQNQDSPFALGVLTILAGHSGPETAADARTHFGIFAPQVWTLFPRNQIINLYFWDYNDVAAGYFAALQEATARKEVGIITIHVARPDFYVSDRSGFADPDLKAAAKGMYLIRDYAPDRPPMGTVLAQGSSSTMNLVGILPRLEKEGVNVRVAAVISPELFDWQPAAHREKVFPDSARYDCMVVSTMTKRVPPLANLGPLTEEYSLYADFDDRWRTGGTEPDVIAEARLDPDSIFDGVVRFARAREERLARQREALGGL
jgi:transketolase